MCSVIVPAGRLTPPARHSPARLPARDLRSSSFSRHIPPPPPAWKNKSQLLACFQTNSECPRMARPPAPAPLPLGARAGGMAGVRSGTPTPGASDRPPPSRGVPAAPRPHSVPQPQPCAARQRPQCWGDTGLSQDGLPYPSVPPVPALPGRDPREAPPGSLPGVRGDPRKGWVTPAHSHAQPFVAGCCGPWRGGPTAVPVSLPPPRASPRHQPSASRQVCARRGDPRGCARSSATSTLGPGGRGGQHALVGARRAGGQRGGQGGDAAWLRGAEAFAQEHHRRLLPPGRSPWPAPTRNAASSILLSKLCHQLPRPWQSQACPGAEPVPGTGAARGHGGL